MLSRAFRALSSGQSARGRSHSQYRRGNWLSMRIDDLKLSCQNSCLIFLLCTKLAFPSLCCLCVLCTGRAFFVALSFTSSVWIHTAKTLLVGLLKPFRLERCWVVSLHVCHSTTCAGSLFSDIPLPIYERLVLPFPSEPPFYFCKSLRIDQARFYDDRPRKTGSVNFAYFLKSCQAAYAPTS